MRCRVRTLLLGALAALLLAPAAQAQEDGENDDSFWSDGKRIYTTAGTSLYLRGLTVSPESADVLVYGAAWTDGTWHSRWHAVGDSTHGTPCNVDLPNYSAFSLSDVAFDAEGRLVVLGRTAANAGDTPNITFVARYLYPACTLDGTFDQDGWTLISWASEFASIVPIRLLVQDDGKLVLAGGGYESGSIVPTPIAFRLLPTGALDTSFSSDGRTRVPLQAGFFTSAAVTPSGKLLMTYLGQASNADFLVALFDASGNYVITSSTPFDLVANGSDRATSVAVGSDSTIYVSGWVQAASTLRAGVVALRFLPNGFLVRDFAFGGDGRVDFVLAAGTYSEVSASVVQGDGKLIVAGRFSNDNDEEGAMAVARLLPDGKLDPEFFPTGFTWGLRRVDFDLGGTDEDAASEVLLHRGRIVLGGSAAQLSGNDALALARLRNAHLFADAFETGDLRRWQSSSP